MDDEDTGCSTGCAIDMLPVAEVTAPVEGLATSHSLQWKPNVDDSILPVVGRKFRTLQEGIEFYMNYARISDFDVRQGTFKRDRDGVIFMRYLLCSRQGVRGGGRINRLPDRDVGRGKNRERQRRISNRLNVSQQAFLANCVKTNIGASTGLRFCKEVAGSYGNVGATDVEFHNFKRDLQTYVDAGDGEMIIEKSKAKHEVCSDFYFDYQLDEDDRLARLFWADPSGRRAFSCYGDTISFDATYGTNRYSMVFVPFTGVNNRKRCITFGVGLLTKEDMDSYSWLLERFKCAMGKTPLCVVTDQDPALRVAIEEVLPESRHRFCMWHIMTKVPEKIGNELAKDEKFRNKLNAIVWNERINSAEFEAQWNLLIDEYNLTTHQWFCKLYTERESWIPAYFTDFPLSGLVRTTSHSEAENSVYGKFTRPHSSLVEFYMQYESVIETQRYRQAKLNAECEGYIPEFKTPLALERHVAQLFTITIFYELQKEIEAACFYSRVVGVREDGGSIYYDIRGECNTIFSVHHDPKGLSASCTCKLFERMGLVCRHMFLVFRDAQLGQLPSQYIVTRWCKHLACGACSGQLSVANGSTCGATRLWADINTCVGLVGSNTERQARLVDVLKSLTMEFASDGNTGGPIKGNRAAIQALCGV
ncbi:PREDICTED: protein FAR1-RELATED SEQUENCE 5-like [Ipomoea nil]|uniref:protein FAR1-RELATED SEQUENCE 5-like n=1 Tax=Ipomoea nil TaxID=35883 RepID=UPI0009010923|nr:PREDICTED: protein FAR1-RELATED SEQUENCE 5-like [Ipomoea nil]